MNAKEIQRDHKRLLDNLRLIQKTHTRAELAGVLGVSIATWDNRMKIPWKYFSYDDFKAISRYCKVDFVQLVDGELKLR